MLMNAITINKYLLYRIGIGIRVGRTVVKHLPAGTAALELHHILLLPKLLATL